MKKTFPYAFARVSAMKAKLVQTEDYHKLLKMDLAGITRYLQESEYREAITKLSGTYEGLELLDQALRMHEEQVYGKLRRICPPEVQQVIDLYLLRSDFQNLKIVLRGLYANATKEEVTSLLEPVGKYDATHFEELFAAGSVQKALVQSKIVTEREVKDAYDRYQSSSRLIELENELDKLYYRKSMEGAVKLSGFSSAFRRFLLRDIDVLNIRNLMRFKAEELKPEEIEDLLVYEGLRLNKKSLRALAGKESLEALYAQLRKTYYSKHVKFEGDIVAVELGLMKYHMKRAFISQSKGLLSIGTILSYLMRKFIEIRNIRSLVKSKHLRIDASYVESNLLVI